MWGGSQVLKGTKEKGDKTCLLMLLEKIDECVYLTDTTHNLSLHLAPSSTILSI